MIKPATVMQSDEIIRLIRSHADSGGRWSIPIDTALTELGVKHAEFYRRLYERRARVDTIAPRTVEADTLFTFLVGICKDIDACEARLHHAGVVMSVAHQSEIADHYTDFVHQELSTHDPDDRAFYGLLREERNHDRAMRRYVSFFFDRDAIARRTIERFLENHREMDPLLAPPRAVDTLAELVRRRILADEVVFASLYRRFGQGEEERSGPTEDTAEGELSRALADMGLARVPETKADLKRVYRSLMKTFHPDVNPAGLETSRRVTTAYSVVLERLSAS